MILSHRIASLLEEMLEESGGEVLLVRNEFAQRMGCVPSQINYVITSRFTPERGYLVESRRGGGGFIRIRKIPVSENEYLMRFYHAARPRLDWNTAGIFLAELSNQRLITHREAKLLLACLSDHAMGKVEKEGRDLVRSDIFCTAVLELLSEIERRD